MTANAKRLPVQPANDPAAPAAGQPVTPQPGRARKTAGQAGKGGKASRAAPDHADRAAPAIQLPGLIDPHDLSADRQFSMNLARGLQVLRAFTASEPVLGNRDLAERTGLPKATI